VATEKGAAPSSANGHLHGAMVYLVRARDELATKEDYRSEAFLACMQALARLERKHD
jgi:hypothetical protein